jgi:hypothetical protein
MIVVVVLPYRTRVRAENKTRASVRLSLVKSIPLTFIKHSPKLTLLMCTVSVKLEEDGSQLS